MNDYENDGEALLRVKRFWGDAVGGGGGWWVGGILNQEA